MDFIASLRKRPPANGSIDVRAALKTDADTADDSADAGPPDTPDVRNADAHSEHRSTRLIWDEDGIRLPDGTRLPDASDLFVQLSRTITPRPRQRRWHVFEGPPRLPQHGLAVEVRGAPLEAPLELHAPDVSPARLAGLPLMDAQGTDVRAEDLEAMVAGLLHRDAHLRTAAPGQHIALADVRTPRRVDRAELPPRVQAVLPLHGLFTWRDGAPSYAFDLGGGGAFELPPLDPQGSTLAEDDAAGSEPSTQPLRTRPIRQSEREALEGVVDELDAAHAPSTRDDSPADTAQDTQGEVSAGTLVVRDAEILILPGPASELPRFPREQLDASIAGFAWWRRAGAWLGEPQPFTRRTLQLGAFAINALLFHHLTDGRWFNAGESELIVAAYPCLPLLAFELGLLMAADKGLGHRLKAALIFAAVVFGGWLFVYGAMWNQCEVTPRTPTTSQYPSTQRGVAYLQHEHTIIARDRTTGTTRDRSHRFPVQGHDNGHRRSARARDCSLEPRNYRPNPDSTHGSSRRPTRRRDAKTARHSRPCEPRPPRNDNRRTRSFVSRRTASAREGDAARTRHPTDTRRTRSRVSLPPQRCPGSYVVHLSSPSRRPLCRRHPAFLRQRADPAVPPRSDGRSRS